MTTETERILVIDPGDRTGWVRAVIADGQITEVTQGVNALKDFALALHKGFANYDTVVYETWRLYPEKAKTMVGNDFQPVQLIGMIRLLGWLHPTVRIRNLNPTVKTTGRKVMPDVLKERLPHSSEEHDKDALDLLSFYWWDRYV